MKIRAFLFLLTFLLGAVTGYVAGQEKSKREANRLFNEASVRVEEWVQTVARRFTPASAKARAKQSSPEAQAPAPVADSPQQKADYIRQFVEITDLQATGDGTTVKAAPTISGRIHNRGERAIRGLDITAYFIGKEGIVSEIRYPAVEQSPLESNANTEFRFKADNVPDSWIKGRLRASVTEIVFVK